MKIYIAIILLLLVSPVLALELKSNSNNLEVYSDGENVLNITLLVEYNKNIRHPDRLRIPWKQFFRKTGKGYKFGYNFTVPSSMNNKKVGILLLLNTSYEPCYSNYNFFVKNIVISFNDTLNLGFNLSYGKMSGYYYFEMNKTLKGGEKINIDPTITFTVEGKGFTYPSLFLNNSLFMMAYNDTDDYLYRYIYTGSNFVNSTKTDFSQTNLRVLHVVLNQYHSTKNLFYGYGSGTQYYALAANISSNLISIFDKTTLHSHAGQCYPIPDSIYYNRTPMALVGTHPIGYNHEDIDAWYLDFWNYTSNGWSTLTVDSLTPHYSPDSSAGKGGSLEIYNGYLFIAYNLYDGSEELRVKNLSSDFILSDSIKIADEFQRSPSLISYKDSLYLFYCNDTERTIYMSNYSGSSWTTPQQVFNVSDWNCAPAYGVHGTVPSIRTVNYSDNLYVFYVVENSTHRMVMQERWNVSSGQRQGLKNITEPSESYYCIYEPIVYNDELLLPYVVSSESGCIGGELNVYKLEKEELLSFSIAYPIGCSASNIKYKFDRFGNGIGINATNLTDYVCQTEYAPTFNITNNGNTEIDINVKYHSLPTGVTMKMSQISFDSGGYESVCSENEPPTSGCMTLTTSYKTAVSNLQPDDWQELWMWADASNFNSGLKTNQSYSLIFNITQS